jgi:hypothetical protein
MSIFNDRNYLNRLLRDKYGYNYIITVTRVGGIFLLGDIYSVFKPIETLLSIYINILILFIIVILTILFILVTIISFYDFILYSYLLSLCLLLPVLIVNL